MGARSDGDGGMFPDLVEKHPYAAWLYRQDACYEAFDWLKHRKLTTFAEAWEHCERVDWLMWAVWAYGRWNGGAENWAAEVLGLCAVLRAAVQVDQRTMLPEVLAATERAYTHPDNFGAVAALEDLGTCGRSSWSLLARRVAYVVCDGEDMTWDVLAGEYRITGNRSLCDVWRAHVKCPNIDAAAGKEA